MNTKIDARFQGQDARATQFGIGGRLLIFGIACAAIVVGIGMCGCAQETGKNKIETTPVQKVEAAPSDVTNTKNPLGAIVYQNNGVAYFCDGKMIPFDAQRQSSLPKATSQPAREVAQGSPETRGQYKNSGNSIVLTWASTATPTNTQTGTATGTQTTNTEQKTDGEQEPTASVSAPIAVAAPGGSNQQTANATAARGNAQSKQTNDQQATITYTQLRNILAGPDGLKALTDFLAAQAKVQTAASQPGGQ